MKKYAYLVTLKLDESNVRGCHRIYSLSDADEYITHSAFGWYNVRVIADTKESAIARAKQNLAKYKNVKVEDFFENTSLPEAWSTDLFLVCPECQREYHGWQMERLECCVCPICRRRCRFEKVKDPNAVRELNKKLIDVFSEVIT